MSDDIRDALQEFGLVLRRGRREKRVSLLVVANMTGLTVSQVSKIERGIGGVPSDDVLVWWSEACGSIFDVHALLSLAAETRRKCSEKNADADSAATLSQRMLDAIEGAMKIKDLWVYPDNVHPDCEGEAQAISAMESEFREILRLAGRTGKVTGE